jgi:hypothetical protein
MGLQTRGSSEMDKAERRLAILKTIDPNLDLGYGLTVAAYSELIALLRTMLDQHNQKVAEIDSSRKTLDDLDRQLAQMSTRILAAVKIKYGKNSREYSQVGGTSSKKNSSSSTPTPPAEPPAEPLAEPMTLVSPTPAAKNGKAKETAQS